MEYTTSIWFSKKSTLLLIRTQKFKGIVENGKLRNYLEVIIYTYVNIIAFLISLITLSILRHNYSSGIVMTSISNSTLSNQIGTLKEKSLHAELKDWLKIPGDKIETPIDGYIIDIVRGKLLIEIQTQNFSAIRKKLENLLKRYEVRLIYPIVQKKWIVCLDQTGAQVTRRRLSPKHNSYANIFEELIWIPHIIMNSNLSIEALIVHVEETRLNNGKGSWRRKGWSIVDRKLVNIIDQKRFHEPKDFLTLIPKDLKFPFTNFELSKALKKSIGLARKMTYCLRKINNLKVIGKKGKAFLYDLKLT